MTNFHTHTLYRTTGNRALSIIVYGLKPNSVHKVYFDGVDIGEACQQIELKANYEECFLAARSAFPSKDADYCHRKIVFDGWRYNGSNQLLDNVVQSKETGASLITSSKGILAFKIYLVGRFSQNVDDVIDRIYRSRNRKLKTNYHILNKTLDVRNNDNTSYASVVLARCWGFRNFRTSRRDLLVGEGTVVGGANTSGNTASGNANTGGANTGGGNSGGGNNGNHKFDCAQTWVVDPALISNATEVYITKVDLFFREKPVVALQEGLATPGCTVFLVPTVNRVPSFTNLNEYPMARVEYSEINASNTAATATTFFFTGQAKVQAGSEYAFVVKHDGNQPFKLWKCVQGDALVGSSTSTSGPSRNYTGLFYEFGADQQSWRPLDDTDLKFKVYCARYAYNGVIIGSPSIEVKSSPLEFVKFDQLISDPRFSVGERVFQVNANLAGTVSVSNSSTSVTGTGTSFQSYYTGSGDPEYIVLLSGNTYCLRQVTNVASNTALTIDSPPLFTNTASVHFRSPVARVTSVRNSMLDGSRSLMCILANSTSNSTVRFSNTSTLRGELSNKYAANIALLDIKATKILPNIDMDNSDISPVTVNATFNYKWNGANAVLASPAHSTAIYDDVGFEIARQDAVLFPSRTHEFTLGGLTSSFANSRVSQITITPTVTNDFAVPRLNKGSIELQAYRYVINNDYTNENTKYGNAHSKHVTKKINLKDDTAAEDMLVYLICKRPANTDIKVLCKLYNKNDADAFDDKDWTLMELTDGNGLYSSTSNDLIELTYGLPQSPNTAFVANGVAQTTLNQSNVIGSGTSFNTELAVNDLVKIYPSLFPNTYWIGVVNSVTNSTHLSLKSPVSNVSVTGTGLKIDKISHKFQAFRAITNDNVARYYSSSMIEHDNFNAFALKIVFLSDNEYAIPCVRNIKATAVSA